MQCRNYYVCIYEQKVLIKNKINNLQNSTRSSLEYISSGTFIIERLEKQIINTI
jgi:hypothetical protein